MNVSVRYYSRGGNTKKLADAIANAIGVEAQSVAESLEDEVDILFLCSSVYWAGVDGKVKDFIQANATKIKRLVNVSTAAIVESTYKQVKSLAKKNDIAVDAREFHCKGSFAGMHKGKPDDTDCDAAAEFAKEIVNVSE